MRLDAINRQFIQRMYDEGFEHNFVLGEGKSDHPGMMLIGEAPGEQEVLQGRPFVGKAGKNLDSFLSVLDIKREDIYITNAVKFRPTKSGVKGRKSNRTPTAHEQKAFIPWLRAEISCVRPGLLVTLGNTPLRAIFRKEASIGDCHGTLKKNSDGWAVFPLYHPAAVIYNRSLLETYQKDLLKLKEMAS